MAEASDNNHDTDWYRSSLPSQPGTSSVRLPPPRAPSTPRHGYDHRRPVTLSPENNVIDLTQGSQSPPQRVPAPGLHHRYRSTLQFPRDIMNRNSEQTPVIDLEAEVNTSAEDLSSGADVQIVGSSTVRPNPIEPRYFNSNGFSMFYPPPRPPIRGSGRGQSSFSSAASGFSRDILSLMNSMPTLAYNHPAFDYIPHTQAVPVQPTQRNSYKAPSPALEGFSRCLEDENVPVCPNCNEELGSGSGRKLEIYIAKTCGHVSTVNFCTPMHRLSSPTSWI